MTNTVRIRNMAASWLGAAGVLSLFAFGAWSLPRVFSLDGPRAWVLRGGLLVFGVAAAVLVLLYLRARASRRPAPAAPGTEDIDQVVAAAEARLAASNLTAESRVARLPLVLLLGPTGSTKSSVLTHSGLDPELLAGEVVRGDAVVPTDPLNVWYAQGTVFVEAGGRLLDDADRWRRMIHHLRPRRLAAAIGRGRQAPRAAILCIGCDEFLKPGASQNLAATARTLRARLADVSQQLGIRLPVYVLFTRADRLPYFADFVRSFTNEEAQQVLGASLPLAADAGGAWAERESRRLNDAFGRIVHALALRRLDVLLREVQPEVRAGAYEFPRELHKIVEPAVQLLLDVFRPSQLGITPFLRGFYFAGVRPIVLSDAAAPPVMPAAPGPMQAGATSVFNPAMLRAVAQPAAPAGGRKVPQWTFVQRLFRDVVLHDEVALRITGGGARVDLLRRGLIGAAAAACLVLALGFTTSFFGNRGLVRGALAAARDARDVGSMPGTPSEADLARLDALRARTTTVTAYERGRRPLRLAWGLYTGDRVQPILHRLYFDRFGAALWFDTRDRLLQYLRGLPARPDENSDFGRAQDALAAHLLTTSEHRRSTTDLLAPALIGFWRGTDATDEARALAFRQFEFFAAELPFGNAYETAADAALVERTQAFLRAFGVEAYYRALVAEANNGVAPVRYVGPANIVRNDVVVPGAFTIAGWRSVQANLDSVDNLFMRYQWIYGDRPPADKPQRSDLARMYEDEYVRRWQEYLARGSVERFSNVGDAAGRLAVLGATTSPLFLMLATASRETALDTLTRIGRAFQPLHATVDPSADARAVTAAATGYANALNSLGTQLNLLAGASGPARDQVAMQAAAGAATIKAEASTIATSFTMSADAALTGSSVHRLLRQPAEFAEALVSGLPAAEMNAAGASFCRVFASVSRRFPFARAADAPVDEVNAIFQKDGGQLWAFYQDVLQPLLTEQGRPKPNARVRADFARFFARAAEFSNALYRDAGGASLVFDFQPDIPAGATEVVLQIDGSSYAFSPTARSSRTFAWDADRSRDARLIVTFGGDRVTVVEAQGAWSLFRLFHEADWTAGNPHRVEWRVPGRAATVAASVSFESGVPPVLRRGYLDPLSQCVAAIL